MNNPWVFNFQSYHWAIPVNVVAHFEPGTRHASHHAPSWPTPASLLQTFLSLPEAPMAWWFEEPASWHWVSWPSNHRPLMRRSSLCTWKTDFTLFLMVEMHYRTSTRGTRTVRHTAAQYGMLQSSTTIRPSFVITLKITINKCQNHGIPAVQHTEIASHPISTHDQHFCSLSSLLSITRSDPWGRTLLSATVIQYKGLQSVTRPPQSLADLHCMSYYQYFIIIPCQRSTFNLLSLTLFLHTLPSSLYSKNSTFQIHLFTFKSVSFIFTPYKISLLHSHPFNI